jgi:hypothetical protein
MNESCSEKGAIVRLQVESEYAHEAIAEIRELQKRMTENLTTLTEITKSINEKV